MADVLTEVRLRDVWLLFALAVAPAIVLGALGMRALRSEEAAVRREAALAVDAAAALVVRAVDDALSRIDGTLSTVGPDADDATLAAALRSATSPLAIPVVLEPSGRLRLPSRPEPTRSAPPAAGCDAVSTGAADARDRVLDLCEDARTASGRWLWPIVALERAPVDAPRFARWLATHRATPAERAAMRSDAARIGATEVAAVLDARGDLEELVASALEDESVRRAIRDASPAIATLRTDVALARVRRLPDGRIAGAIAPLASLATAIPGLSPSGIAAAVAPRPSHGRATEAAPIGFAPLGPTLGVVARHADAAALARSASRSRAIVAALAIAGSVLAILAAAVVLARVRSERRSAALKTDFVSTVSHELRTPLASIRTFAELLEQGRVEPDERAEVHEALAREARRMSALVDRLLSFGRMAAGRVTATRTRTDVGRVVADAIDDLEAREPAMPKVVRELPTVEADVDAAQLRLALDNLLGNARKHAPEGTPYAVRVAASAGEVAISVEDRGPGIARGDRKRIFAPFERGDARLSRATEGSGIGLSLVAHVAEAHGGRVEVASAPGRGATFTVVLRRHAR